MKDPHFPKEVDQLGSGLQCIQLSPRLRHRRGADLPPSSRKGSERLQV